MKFLLYFLLPLILLSSMQESRDAHVQQKPKPDAEESISWYDPFVSQHPRWNWAYNSGTGYKQLGWLPEGGEGIEIGITAASSQSQYSDCSLHELSQQYRSGLLEMRLRLSEDNGYTGTGGGTRGWGYWDGSLDKINAAWFWSASPESSADLVGLRAMVVRDGKIVLNQPLDVDMREWHTYHIDLSSEGTVFSVDGIEVARIDSRPANLQRVELWVDNMVVQITSEGYSRSNLDIQQDQKMWIDWVRLNYADPEPVPLSLFLPLIWQ